MNEIFCQLFRLNKYLLIELLLLLVNINSWIRIVCNEILSIYFFIYSHVPLAIPLGHIKHQVQITHTLLCRNNIR